MRKYEQLYEFIPFFETILVEDAVQWGGGTNSPDGVITMPYPIYDKRIVDFINKIYETNLLDPNYLETIKSYRGCAAEELEDAIDGADQKLLMAILTYYVRQERFCEGLWGWAVTNKVFLRILHRLQENESEL